MYESTTLPHEVEALEDKEMAHRAGLACNVQRHDYTKSQDCHYTTEITQRAR